MAIKFSDKEILVYCNVCGATVYKAITTINPHIIIESQPIQETYKVYCEKCYMRPLIKIKELTEDSSMLEQKLKKKSKRLQAAEKKEREKILEDYEFY